MFMGAIFRVAVKEVPAVGAPGPAGRADFLWLVLRHGFKADGAGHARFRGDLFSVLFSQRSGRNPPLWIQVSSATT